MIRNMTVEDLDQVMSLELACFSVPWTRESFENELTKNMLAKYIVIEEEGEIIGYGGVWYIMDEGHITNVAIHPEHRKKGLGKLLVEKMKHNARIQGIKHMTLEVRVSNVAAITLYSRMGFEKAGIRPKYYTDNNEDALIMWVELGD
ncbi:ribosomal protein S18-alanine N-acetyltransferase [Acidaminobacter sp. JC074]|uniref:ribosomal protein S18-alanine N-acetyltransferase n=1 Tax=Acidaminobacter sp. JC074 TaxID=2530199 RepID=UPI001F0DB971|nr:ribosomal protein S18-alanine N-acetyltransferase [Acidaminobacter sp. JC074]